MKDILRRIAWRVKWNWRVLTGHFIDHDGFYSSMPCEKFRFVYGHEKTGEVRYEDRAFNPWYVRLGIPTLEVVAVLVLFWALYLAWVVLP